MAPNGVDFERRPVGASRRILRPSQANQQHRSSSRGYDDDDDEHADQSGDQAAIIIVIIVMMRILGPIIEAPGRLETDDSPARSDLVLLAFH